MGGSVEADSYLWFLELCIQGYLAIRPYHEAIVSLVSLMLDKALPCFRGKTLKYLTDRFKPDLSDHAAADHLKNVIGDSCLSKRTKWYQDMQDIANP